MARAQDGPGPAGIEFFEKQIRPLLAEKCQKCHGGARSKGGLSLTGRDLVLQGGERGPAAVPGKARDSLLVSAVERRGELKMPPKERLSTAEIDGLKRWIDLGLPWPEAKAPAARGQSRRRPRVNRRVGGRSSRCGPPVHRRSRTRAGRAPRSTGSSSPSSRRGIKPAAPADRRTLLRRATFDLTGLPPRPDEIDGFLADRSPDAFAKVVDRLLASPAYGERWGRHWLDVVRYTDYFYAEPHAHPRSFLFELFEAWRYRDWVVGAFNRDMPYDRFIVHQISGDLVPSPRGEPVYPDGLVATGLLALSVFDNGDGDKLKIVTDIVDDQIDVIGKAFLGLTLACARCHDHKFDPVSQLDYYGLAGIFHSTHILTDVGAPGDHTVALRALLVPKSYVERRERQVQTLRGLEVAANGLKHVGARSSHRAARRLVGGHTARQRRPAGLGARGHHLPARTLVVGKHHGRVLGKRDSLRSELLPEPPRALAAQEGGTKGAMFTGIQDVPLHIRGSYTRLGPVVPRHVPEFLGEHQPPITSGSGRPELARWIARADNPLTARVIVNRVWQHHFGEGIVRTPSNFGKLGERPSHPRLLDWLADRFIRDGWSIKRLHRRIVLSAAFQQSSAADPESLRLDPENRWLGRISPRRLEAEAIRDGMLSSAGQLDRTPGGPATATLDRPRRSLYVQTVRQDRGNFSTLFDAANPEASVESRSVSTVAPQALFMVNSPFVLAAGGAPGATAVRPASPDQTTRIDRAYQLLFGRPATAGRDRHRPVFPRPGGPRGRDSAWPDYAHVLLCSNEFIYVD